MLINRRFHSQAVIKMAGAFRWSELVGVFSWGVVTSKMFGTSVLSSLFFFPLGDFAFKTFALSASSSLLGVMHKQGCLGGILYWIRFLELQFRPRRLPPSSPPIFFFFFFFGRFLSCGFCLDFFTLPSWGQFSPGRGSNGWAVAPALEDSPDSSCIFDICE